MPIFTQLCMPPKKFKTIHNFIWCLNETPSKETFLNNECTCNTCRTKAIKSFMEAFHVQILLFNSKNFSVRKIGKTETKSQEKT